MADFTPVDRSSWSREPWFDHYFSQVPCTYSMTVSLDITPIRQRAVKLYPAMLYCLSRAANARRGPANVRCGCGEEMSEMSERMTRNWNEQVPHASAHSAVRFSKLIIPS